MTATRATGSVLIDGRAYFKTGPDAYVPVTPTNREIGATFTRDDLRLKHPLAAVRRRAARLPAAEPLFPQMPARSSR